MKVGSLCTGYGGLEMGLKEVFPSARLAWVADNDKAASVLLKARYPGVPNLGDIKAIDWSAVEKVDVITAGYPCQPFSDAGKQLDQEDERDITGYVLEALRVLRPKFVVLENVGAHLRRGFPRVLGSLAAMGFDARWHCVRASAAGASHRRERLFVLAYPANDGQQRDRSPWLGRQGLEDGNQVVADAVGFGDVPGTERRNVAPARRGAQTVPNPNCGVGHGGADESIGESQEREASERHSEIDWGEYEAAVRRQERIFGRVAPPPTEVGLRGNVRLSPYFTEWMMGPPAGWITDFEFARKDAFRLLGNGVVPRQAALAIRGLVDEESKCAAGWRGSAGIDGPDGGYSQLPRVRDRQACVPA